MVTSRVDCSRRARLAPPPMGASLDDPSSCGRKVMDGARKVRGRLVEDKDELQATLVVTVSTPVTWAVTWESNSSVYACGGWEVLP